MKIHMQRILLIVCWIICALCTSFCSKELTGQVNKNFCDHQTDEIFLEPKLNFLDIQLGKSTPTDLILEHGEPRHMGSYKVKGVDILSYQYFLENTGYIYFAAADNVISEVNVGSPGYVLYNDRQQLVYLSDIVSIY